MNRQSDPDVNWMSPVHGKSPLVQVKEPYDNLDMVTCRVSTCNRERSGSVVECLTRDRRAAGSSLTGVTALWSLSKTHLS